MQTGLLNRTIALPLVACRVFSGVHSQFGSVKIETDQAGRVYIHHCSWLGFSSQDRHVLLLDSACAVSAWLVIRCADLCRVWICAHGVCCGHDHEVQPSHCRHISRTKTEGLRPVSCSHMCCPKAMIRAEMGDFTPRFMKTSYLSFVLWRDLDGLCDSSVYSWNLGSHVHGRYRVSSQTNNESHATQGYKSQRDTLETADDVVTF